MCSRMKSVENGDVEGPKCGHLEKADYWSQVAKYKGQRLSDLERRVLCRRNFVDMSVCDNVV